MNKLELTFKTDHADLFRNEQNELIVHLVGVDADELQAALSSLRADLEAEEAASEQDNALSEKVEG